jgi:hypothetical protein
MVSAEKIRLDEPVTSKGVSHHFGREHQLIDIKRHPFGRLYRLRGVDSNHRPPGYEPDELPLLYPAPDALFHSALSEPVLYPTHSEASRIDKEFLTVKVHYPADAIIILAHHQ